jgi:hypothetical protein
MHIEYALNFDVKPDPRYQDNQAQTCPEMYLYIDHETDRVKVRVIQMDTSWANVVDLKRQVSVSLYDKDRRYEDAPPWPDPEQFANFIHTKETKALIHRIADGYSLGWSDHRPGIGYRIAVLEDDALEALDELERKIAELEIDEREFYTMEEWCSQINVLNLSEEDLEALIEDPSGGDENIVIIDDPREYVESLKNA